MYTCFGSRYRAAEKNVLHGSGARFLSAVLTDLLIMEAQVGQLQAQLVQTQAELQYAMEQIRILTIQVNNKMHRQPQQQLQLQYRIRQQHQQTPQQVPILKRPK